MAEPFIKSQFPALMEHSPELIYLDSAATTQKPAAVLEAVQAFYLHSNANVHRGAHALSIKATSAYERARAQIAQFVDAESPESVIICYGTTHAINTVAHGLTHQLSPGDIILVDGAAHHANIVPWQQLAKRTGAELYPIPLLKNGSIDLPAYQALLQRGPKLVSLNHVSNVLGHANPLDVLIPLAKTVGALTLVDGAQAVAHLPVSVRSLGCDYYVFSGHKMYGPTGVGILTGKRQSLEQLEPMMSGGEMIKTVRFEHSEFAGLPNRLEAGTPPIAQVIGLAKAVEFIQSLDRQAVAEMEQSMLRKARAGLQQLGYFVYGDPGNCHGALAFNLLGEHHQDIGTLLDQQQVAIRCGYHCAMPLMEHLGTKGSCRLSVAAYNTPNDIDRAIEALAIAKDMLSE
ncbi:aminotransferase class V-fold PLP-dependent enzyme [Paraferrimonas haliotis]|uniref:cysteine desulfurase n=1 Tax=Paraferrimonas haliotis TaxID=2013866 RepID=A0AA37TT61_9GAMM|nr:cysteine desulfurase [Paraferrimonas haliotis]GLS82420.1 cysteine desulfurase [Paraferrimonas haliotis]